MLKLMELKGIDENSTQKRIVKQMGTPESIIKGYKSDLFMSSLQNTNVDQLDGSLSEQLTKKDSRRVTLSNSSVNCRNCDYEKRICSG